MDKYIKIKNPCKICFQSVTKKTGLQCKGACRKWAHYTCLHYTPEKIKDIKAGIVEVICPCPNCDKTVPKETLRRKDPPFMDKKEECSGSQSLICPTDECPNKNTVYQSKKPPLSPDFITSKTPSSAPPRYETPSSAPCGIPTCPSLLLKSSKSPVSTLNPLPPKSSKPIAKHRYSPPEESKSQLCLKKPSCCSLTSKSLSCTCLMCCKGDNPKKGKLLRTSCSDSDMLSPSEKQRMLFSVIEQLCGTVGQLSTQIKELICKMMSNIDSRD